MTPSNLAALGRSFFAAQDRLRGGPDPALCTTGYQAVLGGHPPMPLAGHQAFATAFYAGFPDIVHTVDEVFATADRIAVRFTLRGTHTGNFFGVPATGKPVIVTANILMHVEGGKVATLFGVFDEVGLLRQIGAIQ